jgi:carboxyl-terminal processing protease
VSKGFSKILRFFPTLIILGCVLAVGIFIGQNYNLPVDLSTNFKDVDSRPRLINKESDKEVDFSLFWQVWGELESMHIDKKEIDSEKMLYGAISGMVDSLGDPYTSFFDPQENKEFKDQLSGVYEGVGIQLGYKDKQLVVMAPLSGTPAESVGVKAGDLILKIGDKETTGVTLPEAVSLIRGPAGSSIRLTLLRKGADKPYEAEIVRDKIKVKSVELVEKEGKIAHVRLSRFGDGTNQEWDETVEKVLSEGYKGVVLDLRNNPGGYLESAIYISSEFLNEGVVVRKELSGGRKEEVKVDREGRLINIPLIVLINQGSASASEIVAGALQDYNRATVVGEKSFGKGTVQATRQYENGAGLHITVEKWLTPNGSWVNETGITPQLEVLLSEEDFKAGGDPQLDKALELLK